MKAPLFFISTILWAILISIGPIQSTTARHCHGSNWRYNKPRHHMPRVFIPVHQPRPRYSSSRSIPPIAINPRFLVPSLPESSRVPLQARAPQISSSNYLNELEDGELSQWPGHKRVLSVFVKPGNFVSGFRSSYISSLVSAFQEWTRVSNGRLQFRQVANERDADIVVSWVSQLNSNGNAHEVGKTYTITKRYRGARVGLIEKAHINFLTHLNGRTMSDQQMRKIALHEIGHAIGIQGHSSDPRDIMFHSTSPYQNASLTSRDINTMKVLYGNQLTANLY